MLTFALGLLSGLAGAFLLAFLEPVQRWLARRGRHLLGSDGIQVHVEADPAVIWAGLPDWQGFFYHVPEDTKLPAPPSNPREWRTWVTGLGGWDLYESIVRVTLVATAPTTVVLETPTVNAEVRELPAGNKVAHSVGGADMQPRAFYVDLDAFGASSPQVTLADVGGDEQALPHSYSLKKDEVEVFLLRVTSLQPQLISWNARIPILIDGRRQFIDIKDHGHDFALAGGDLQGPRLVWNGAWRTEEG